GYASYFLAFPGDDGAVWLEVMTVPGLAPSADGEAAGYAHLALSLGSRAAVDAMAARLADAGVPLVSAPRVTGDGYYEAVVRDPEGNLLEITE
ncbi:MAG TPA: VOC family protein, partial [Longimicrobiaceae bacterium]